MDEKLARNERTKLSAVFLNNVAVAIVATGLVAPFFAVLYGMSGITLDQARFFGLAAPGWVLIGGAVHYIGRSLLGRLKV